MRELERQLAEIKAQEAAPNRAEHAYVVADADNKPPRPAREGHKIIAKRTGRCECEVRNKRNAYRTKHKLPYARKQKEVCK